MEESKTNTDEVVPVDNNQSEPPTIQQETVQPITIQDISVPSTTTVSVSSLLTIDDILGTLMLEKESKDRAELENIGNMPIDELKESLTFWVKLGFPNDFALKRICIEPPTKCVDGITRNLRDYIQYCSGKTIEEHATVLQSKLSGMTISVVESYGCFTIAVSKT